MNYKLVLAELAPWLQALLTDSSCHIVSDGMAAVLIVENDEAVGFVNQLYILSQIYPVIRKMEPSVKHLHVLGGSTYDSVRNNQTSVVSIS